MNIIHLPTGTVQGKQLDTDLRFFGGLPYAAPPFGTRRFLAPQLPEIWSGIRNAHHFGAPAPQAPKPLDDSDTLEGGEDCLTLNVWAPSTSKLQTGSGLPVLIWIPGGGFMRGKASDPIYDGRHFAAQGIVVVSLNYRIGIDGFLQLDGYPNNRGLLDQIAAIQWVRQHIHLFGGDAEQITLGGVSAGAGSICNLLATPALRGQIKRAILQSPSASCQTLDEAKIARQAIARLLDCAPSAQDLAAQPLHKVVRVLSRLVSDYELRSGLGMSAKNFFPLRPVIDHDLLQATPLQMLATQWADRDWPTPDLLVGANRDEMNFYLVPTGEIDHIDFQRVQAFAAAANITLPSYLHEQHPGQLLAQMQSDYYYQAPARDMARLACARARVWHYDFAWKSSLRGGTMGAAHATELPFVFNHLNDPRGADFVGAHAPQSLADTMHGAWGKFIRGEAPEPSTLWPQWSVGRANTRIFS